MEPCVLQTTMLNRANEVDEKQLSKLQIPQEL